MINKMIIKERELEAIKGKRFYDKYLNLELMDEDLNECFDNEITKWHNGDNVYLELHEFLGLSEPEFDTIVKNSSQLGYILWEKSINEGFE